MEVKPASTLPMSEVATLVNIAFQGYAGRVFNYTGEELAVWLEKHFITLERSYVFYDSSSSSVPQDTPDMQNSQDSQNLPVAFALMATRSDKPGHIRLVSMGALTKGQGHGSAALKLTIQEERQRGTEVLELECMTWNAAGLALYRRAGFEVCNELPGWETDVVTDVKDVEGGGELEEVSVDEVQRVVKEHGASDIPWQAYDFGTQFPFAERGFKLGEAYCVISNPIPPEPKKDSESEVKEKGQQEEASTIKLATLVVQPSHRGQGQGTRLVKTVMSKFSGHKWLAVAIFPRKFGEGICRRVGGRQLETGMVQMRLRL